MADSDPDPTPPTPVDTHRLRRVRRIVGCGVLVAVGVALAAGLAGASGRAGAAILLLLSATGCAAAATYGVLTAVRDDLRGEHVSRTRVAWVVGCFVAAAALMAMTAGAGG